MRYRGMIYANQKGLLLIGLLITIAVVGIGGTAAMYLSSGSSYTEVFKNNNLKAYYLAEAGSQYAFTNPAITQYLADGTTTNIMANLNNQTFTVSPGQFTLTADITNPAYVLITSTGIVNSGTLLQTKRNVVTKITYSPGGGGSPASPAMPTNTLNTTDSAFNRAWGSSSGTEGEIKNNSQTGGVNAIQIETNSSFTSLFSLKWNGAGGVANASAQNLLTCWNLNNLLSYKIQLKALVDAQEGGHGLFYLLGLSFRLDNNTNSSYGISFFRKTSSTSPPWWTGSLKTALNIAGISNDKVYLVFWKKVSGTYTLIDYRLVTPSDGVIASVGGYLGGDTISSRDWSTIIVDITETMPGGVRRNAISAWLKGAATYPQGTINWNASTLDTPVVWNSVAHQPQPIVDSSLTSATFNTRLPNEVGIHGNSDSSTKDLYISDFAMETTCGGGGGGGGTTYYY